MTITSSSLSSSAGGTPAPPRASSAATRSPRRATSRRSASRASATRASSPGSGFMSCSVLQRDQAVLLLRPQLALGLEVLQGLGQVFAGVGRLDHVIDEAAAGRDVGRREGGAILFDKLGATG